MTSVKLKFSLTVCWCKQLVSVVLTKYERKNIIAEMTTKHGYLELWKFYSQPFSILEQYRTVLSTLPAYSCSNMDRVFRIHASASRTLWHFSRNDSMSCVLSCSALVHNAVSFYLPSYFYSFSFVVGKIATRSDTMWARFRTNRRKKLLKPMKDQCSVCVMVWWNILVAYPW